MKWENKLKDIFLPARGPYIKAILISIKFQYL